MILDYFCQYSDLLGLPGKGIHSLRIGNIAVVDVILLVVVAYIISAYFKGNFFIYFVVLFLLGIVLHRVFCVRTTIDKLLFA